MGDAEKRKGRSRALAGALLLTLAWPSAALAQDAIDVESSFATFNPIITAPEEISTAALTEEQARVFIAANGGRRLPECVNSGDFAGVEQLPRVIHAASGGIGATYTSNASETDGGEDDIITTTSIRVERVGRSRRGMCRKVGPNIVFDANRILTLYGASTNQAFREDNGTDSSRILIGGRIDQAIDDGTALGDRYRTRVFASLDNSGLFGGVYDDWIATTHDARVGISHIIQLHRADAATGATDGSLTVQAAVGRVFANPERASYNLATVQLTRDWQINSRWTVKATGSVTYQNYDEAVPQDFDDTRYRLGLSASYQFSPDTFFEASANVDARTSDIPVREFEAMSMPLTLRFVRKF